MDAPAAPPPNIFISYRRTDSPGHAGRLHDALRSRFGRAHVFYDVSTVEAGIDFSQAITQAIDQSALVLAIIGPEWGQRRLVDRLLSRPDWVRFEIEYARRAGKPILPVLVDGASMPRSLPVSLRFLSTIHATTLRDDTWDSDVERLVGRVPVVAATRFAPGPPMETPASRRNLVVAAAVAVLLVGVLLTPWIRTWFDAPDGGANVAPGPSQGAPAPAEPVSQTSPPPAANSGGARSGSPAAALDKRPAPNRPPTTGEIAVDQFNTVGLMAATNFTMTAKGISDPDGDDLKYRWDFGDGSAPPPSAPTVTKVYDRVNRFKVHLFVNDGKLAEDLLAAATDVTVRGISGNWLLTVGVDPKGPYPMPARFDVALVQEGNQLSGRITPAGGTRSTLLNGSVEHPARVRFGSEHAWWNDEEDAYFDLEITDGFLFIQMRNRTPNRCGSNMPPCTSAFMNKQ